MIRRAAIAALFLSLLASAHASADPISLVTYRGILGDARAQLELARRSTGSERRDAIERALTLLRGVTEVRVGPVVYTSIPHAPILVVLDDPSDEDLALASGMLATSLDATVDATLPQSVDPANARARLDATLASPDFRRVPDWRDALVELIRGIIAGLFPDLRAPRLTLFDVVPPLAIVALVLVVVILSNVRRGLRAKIAREAALATALAPPRPLAADHLRTADESLRAGRLREALRSLFLAALAGLEERGGVRLDPALTDREILARAAASPRAGELAALVRLYEPAWYGVREPTGEELERARDLARRIGA